MRQRFFLSFVVLFILLLCGCGKRPNRPQKSETEGGYKNRKGEYEIRNVEQLIWIADKMSSAQTGQFPNDDKTVVKLMNDLNLAGKNFIGMTADDNSVFNGTFDGGGFIIENMSINSPNGTNVGFIGKTSLSAVIKNLTLKDAKVVGGQYSAIIVGQNIGIIERCGTVGGSVEGTSSVGAIAGRNENGGTIKECYNTSSVKSSGQYAGGIVGDNVISGAFVENSYNIGDVQATGAPPAQVGGIAGKNGGSVLKCYNLFDKAGGKVVGDAGAPPPDSTADKTKYENGTALDGMGWDFAIVWRMILLSDFSERPVLRNNMENGIPVKGENEEGYKNSQGEYEMRNADQLTWIANQVNSSAAKFQNNDKTVIKLMNDINLTGKNFPGIAVGGSVDFNGTFDGGGFLIENMNIHLDGRDYVGFIGKTSSTAVVRNLRFKNVDVKGKDYVGIVVGDNSGIIERCGTSGDNTRKSVKAKDYVGAIAGNNRGTIRECYNTATVYSELSSHGYSKVGGIVGFNEGNGLVENAYNLGEVETSFAGGSPTPVGGIAGGNAALLTQTTGVSKCYSLKNKGTEFAQLIGSASVPSGRSPTALNELNKTFLERKGLDWDFTNVWEIRGGKPHLKHVK